METALFCDSKQRKVSSEWMVSGRAPFEPESHRSLHFQETADMTDKIYTAVSFGSSFLRITINDS